MKKIALTTDHPSSSYGLPVLVIDGQAYGPGDMTPLGPAAEVAAHPSADNDKNLLDRFLAQLPPPSIWTVTCYRCGHVWSPDRVVPPKSCPACRSPYWDRPRKTQKR